MKDFQYSLRPALELLYSRRFHDAVIETSARSLTRKAIETCMNIITQQAMLPLKIVIDLIAKLDKTRIVVGFTESFLSFTELEKYYKELSLQGDENYIRTWHSALRHQQKIDNEPNESWRRKVNEWAKSAYIKLDATANILCKFISQE